MDRLKFEKLETERLCLRRLTDADLEAFVEYRDLPQVARYQSWDAYSVEDGQKLIDSMRSSQPDTPGEWFQFAITERLSGVLVGDCGICVDRNQPRLAEIGFTLAPAHQGQGYATEAVRALLGYAFSTLRLHRVIGNCDARNLASARVLERAGMRPEAHFIEDYWSKGEWTSSLIYAILEREWQDTVPDE
jgi:RimJ/RimL family protein N-acetyltransferase